MYFNIDYVNEDFIDGWLTPDNPTTTPKFIVETDRNKPIILEANVYRPDLVDAKIHDTGLVGFRFDNGNIPGFSQCKEVVIKEASLRRPIYRRTEHKNHINSKILLLNNISIPNRSIRSNVSSQFLLSYTSLDELGIETAISLLRNGLVKSIFAEGRIRLAGRLHFVKELGYHISALIEEPFIELANRILVVKAILQSQYGEGGLQSLSPAYSALKECVYNLKDTTVAEVNFVFSNLSVFQKGVIADPLTRMLACNENEEPEPRHVSVALGALSEFDSVGLLSDMTSYMNVMSREIPELDLSKTTFPNIGGAFELADTLRQSTAVKKLLRNDSRVYSYIESSIHRALES